MNSSIPIVFGSFIVGIIEPFSNASVLIPPYLLGFVLGLILLTVVTMFLRLGVYQHLSSLAHRVRSLIYQQESRGKKPRIVEELELRCKEANPNLEKINTGALIDQVYSRHLLKNEQIDYFCRFLPNLLLALGLLGTFLGITINLSELSTTINEFGVGSIDTLVEQVQRPLQGMGVAFISSLTAVACSAVLTVVNLLRNTNIAKYQLVSALEDYIDNVYGPELNKRSPIDKAVDRLESLFEAFSDRFAGSMKEAIASSLGEKVDKIDEGNRQANHLATQVYNRFMESSSAMMSGATMFRESAQIFENSQFANKLSNSTEHLSTTQRDLARSASVLNQSTQALQLAIASLQTTSQETIHLGEEIAGLNKNSSQVLNVTQTNQQALANVLDEMQQSAKIFHSVIKTLDTLQKRLATRTDRFVEVHSELSQLVETLRIFTEEMRGGMQTLGDRLVESMQEQNQPNAAQNQVSHRISKLGKDLNVVQAQLAQVVKNLEGEQPGSAPTQLSSPQESNAGNPFNSRLVNWEQEEQTDEDAKSE